MGIYPIHIELFCMLRLVKKQIYCIKFLQNRMIYVSLIFFNSQAVKLMLNQTDKKKNPHT